MKTAKNKNFLLVIVVFLFLPFISTADFSQPSFTGYYAVNSQANYSNGYNTALWGAFSQTLHLPAAPTQNTPPFYLKLSAEDLGLQHDCKLAMAVFISSTHGGYVLRPTGDISEQTGKVYYVGGSDYASDPNNLVNHEVTVPFTQAEEFYGYAPIDNLDQLTGLYFMGLWPAAGSPYTPCYHRVGYVHNWVDAAIKFGYGTDTIANSQLTYQTTDAQSTTTDEDLTFTIKTDKTPVNTKIPVLIVPGVLGTDIKKGDELLWANPKMVRGFDGFMDPLAFTNLLTPSDNELVIDSVIRKKSLAGFISHYTDGLINELTSSEIGYTEGKDLFTFPYDWRYGLSGQESNGSTTADRLKSQIDYILTQTEAGKAIGKVNIVAHSTGGLLVKQYVINHPTDHHIDKAVFVGVPNLGAPKALKVLISGDDMDVANLDAAEMKKISQNLPVVYDLAPSEEYYKQAGSFFHVFNPLAISLSDQEKDLNFTETFKDLVDRKYLNGLAVANAQKLHTTEFDNYDLRKDGVNLYSLVGCKTATFGKITETFSKNSDAIFDYPKVVSGDKTVPLISADSLMVDGTKTFFAPKINHGDLLSADGSRQQIVNLLTGSTLSNKGKVLTRSEVKNKPELCEIKGEKLTVKSPVSIDITDQDGHHAGVLLDGSLENLIPGADYEVWGEHKYVFLPTDEGQIYSISLAGTGVGTFTFVDESQNGNEVIKAQVFSNLPVTTALKGTADIAGDTTILKLDNNGDGVVDQILEPSAILDSNQSQDLTPPVSTSTIAGIMGSVGYYRSNATITLSSLDPIVNNDPSQTSGLLKMQYSLDGQGYQTCLSIPPPPASQGTPPIPGGENCSLSVTTEGRHTINFFATDKAGNNEPEQTLSFIIDKTPPELIIKFNPGIRDLDFTATDTLPTVISSISTPTAKKLKPLPLKVVDSDNIITAIDSAGNITTLTFIDKDRKHKLQADVKSLSYNGISQDINKLKLHFDWKYDKKGKLQVLAQNIQAKKDFNVSAIYGLNKTIILGKDKNGKINQVISGLALLTVATNQGDFLWGW